jgi:hypothetical protein
MTLRIIIILMMDAVSISEVLVNFYETTWCNIPEENHLHTLCPENLKTHLVLDSVCGPVSCLFDDSDEVLGFLTRGG